MTTLIDDDLKTRLDGHQMPILVTTADGRILHSTPDAALAFAPDSSGETGHVNAFDWIRDSYTEEKSQQQILRLSLWLERGSISDPEPIYLTSEDQKSWKLSVIPQLTGASASVLWLWIFQDTSSSRLLEQHESHSRKMEVITRFAGGMAHEFNNLLTAILGNLDLARMILSRPVSDVADRLVAAEKAALRMNHLIQQLRRFASRDSMTQEVQSLLPIVQRVRTSLAALCDERITVTVTVAEPDSQRLSAKFNAEQLEDALMKLGQNALEAIGEMQGQVNFDLRIVTAGQGETLQLTIEDTGSGMSPEAQGRAFEPFFSTKDPNTSSGLGMAVAYGLIEEMNGTVQILKSTRAGTDVRVSFPISQRSTVSAGSVS